jgi:hypothetical protein
MIPRDRAPLAAAWFSLAVVLALLAPAVTRSGDVPCAEELRSMCKGIEPGDGRVLSCLRARWGDLSQACRDRLDRTASAAEYKILTCEPELFRFCSDVPAQRDATLACLAAHLDELAPACRTTVERERSRGKALLAACRDEAARFCAGAGDDAAKLTVCLAERSKELSPGCAAAISR